MSVNPEPSALEPRELHLRDHWRVVSQRRWVVAVVFLFVVATVALYSFLAAPIYEATATVEIQPQARRLGPAQDVSGIGAAGYGWFAEEKYQNTQVDIVRSRAIAERAFEDLGIKDDPRFARSKDPVGLFRSMIRVVPRRETGLIEISMRSGRPDEAARWVNAVSDTYIARNLEQARQNAAQALQAILKLMAPLKEQFSEVEAKRFDVLKETSMYNPEGQQEIVRQRLTKLNEGLNAAVLDVSRYKELLAKIQEIRDGQGDPMSISELATDETLRSLGAEKVNLERDFEAVKVTYRPGATPYREAESRLQKVNQRIWDQVAINLGRIQNRYDLAFTSERSLRAKVQDAEQEAFQVGLAASKYDVVKTDASTTKSMYDAIAKTMNEVNVSSQLVANNITLLDHAIPPVGAVSPNKKLNLVLAVMIGMLLGVATAFFLDYLDNTFHRPEDIEQHLQLNTVAVVPRFAPAAVGSHAVKEAYQTLRTALIFLSRNRERKVVLFTSSAPQEGKSSTVAEIGRALASAGDRVLIVDCDCRRPTQHIHLALTRDNGLTDFLAAPQPFMNWRAYLKETTQPNLQALTCGPIPPNPPELLGSERFKRFVTEAREAYDWVILDSPPAATLSDATLLAGLADMVIMVVRHNQTDRDVVVRTVQQLRRLGANVAGVVMNNVNVERGYGKDYYYGGYYAADETTGKRTKKTKVRSAGSARASDSTS